MDSGDDDISSPPLSNSQAKSRRREQVRRAQRTHRERRAKYLKGLEAEVDVLRAKDQNNLAELARVSAVNDGLRSLLLEHGILIPPELEYRSDSATNYNNQALNAVATPARSDITTSRTTSSVTSPGSERVAHASYDLNDAQTAIDFILSLEAICLEAHHHHVGVDGEMGHFMQLQHMMLETPQSSRIEEPFYTYPPIHTKSTSPSHLDESLTRLLQASKLLNIAGELTPVQCWDMLRAWPPATNMTKQKFNELKRALVAEIVCYGFGASVSEPYFLSLISRILPHSAMSPRYLQPSRSPAQSPEGVIISRP